MSRNQDSTVSRRRKIFEMVSTDGEVIVQTLSAHFGVSEVTIRNDLAQMERKGLVIRARGGAVKGQPFAFGVDRPGQVRQTLSPHTSRIAERAAQLIKKGDTIIMGPGSIQEEMVEHLPNTRGLTVISNALNVVSRLSHRAGIHLIVPGGYLHRESQSLIGPQAEKALRNLRVDKAFLSVDGFDSGSGLYASGLDEARVCEVMIEISKEIILVTDAGNFSRRGLVFVCPVDELDRVVTNNGISSGDRMRLREAGVDVIVA